MQQKDHWEAIYITKTPDELSWYQPHAEGALRLIRDGGITSEASIIDVGGGASTLVDDLLGLGFEHLTVLDLSGAALAAARARLGQRASRVHWIEGDIIEIDLLAHGYDLWHDRAVFHFLTDPGDRQAYVQKMRHAVKPGGLVVMATFAEDGPMRCSGLPVCRYSPEALAAELGPHVTLLDHERDEHRTPTGVAQAFEYCSFRNEPA